MRRRARRPHLATITACTALALAAAPTSARDVLPQQSGTVDLLTQANVQIDGAAAGDHAASSVAAAGDVNGDGIQDVIIGAPTARNNNRNNSGSAYVVFGQASPTRIDLANLGSHGFRIDGAGAGDNAGGAVAGAGDLNGDGLADVIVAAQNAAYNGVNSGSAYVVFGKASTSHVDLASLGSQGFEIDGAAGDRAGLQVAGVGDVNGDGIPDVAVGAPDASNNGRIDSGTVYLVFGKSSSTTVDLSTFSGAQTTGLRIDGAAANDFLGRVAAAGDVNGDGHPDLIAGAVGAGNNARANSGSAYVVFGKASTSTVDLATFTGAQTTGFRIDGAAADDFAGISVAGAGDLNGDAHPDVVVGAQNAGNNGRADSGSAYVVFGKSSGTTIDLAGFDGTQTTGFRIDGPAAQAFVGNAVAGAGDVNGDGVPDLILGAAVSNNSRPGSGSAYVVFGKASTATVDLATFDAGQGFRIDGAAAGDGAGSAVAGAGDINGDGRPDVIVGAPGAGNNDRATSGSAYEVYGFATPSLSYPGGISGAVGQAIAPLAPTVSRTGPASFAVSPPLPAGLSLDPSTGVISGTPTQGEPTTTHSVTMTDLAGSTTAPLQVTIASGGGTTVTTTTTTTPTGTTGGATLTKPALILSALTRERFARQRGVIFTVRSDKAARLLAGGTISIPGAAKVFKLPSVAGALVASTATQIKLRLSAKLVRAIKRALRQHQKVVATVMATASNAAGATSATRRIRGRL